MEPHTHHKQFTQANIILLFVFPFPTRVISAQVGRWIIYFNI